MFVFTRRAMQQMLDNIAPWMPARPLAELVGRLNTARTNRLPQMWELAWLYALGSVVLVEHERPLTNGKPDLWFSVSYRHQIVPVVADITTLSDSALHGANQFERLSEALHQQARKAGIQGGRILCCGLALGSGRKRLEESAASDTHRTGFRTARKATSQAIRPKSSYRPDDAKLARSRRARRQIYRRVQRAQ